jgi:type I restriction enzyme M protein
MHILHWLSVDGTAAIVEFPGVLYRGGAEKKIREYLVANNFVDAVIQLPPDLFFGTTIATCVIVLKKSKTTSDIAFIDATAEFTRRGNKNRLTVDHQARILDALAAREDVDHFVKVVPNEDVLAYESKLSVTAWVQGADAREVVDIVSLNAELAQIAKRQAVLREQIDGIVAELEENA